MLTLMTSASLLFWLQPMAAKFILPSVGGAPAVWNTAMLFFQAALLAGYVYAHLLGRHLTTRTQALVHVTLLILCLGWLPIGVDVLFIAPPSEGNPSAWVLAVLGLGVGVPFTIVAGSAPLLQSWFAVSRHKDAHDPYFLYAASNVGSMAALFGFPLVAEPLLDLDGQSLAWSVTFLALIVLTALCAVLTLFQGVTRTVHADPNETVARPALAQRFLWLALVMCSTSLMLGVTTHITLDVAAVPLLWVVPLALFLATFIIAFARQPVIDADASFRLLFWALGAFGATWAILDLSPSWLAWVAALLGVFFIIVLACHSELARIRPHKAWLTEFYLWIAVGGVLGGAFNALAAPLLFDSTIEFPLMMAVSVTLILAARRMERGDSPKPMLALAALCVLAPVAAEQSGLLTPQGELERDRNYFGMLIVRDDAQSNTRMLGYGRTIHGVRDLTPGRATQPSGYYSVGSAVFDTFAEIAARPKSGDIGAIGLGVGAVACFPTGERAITFYEINPTVTRIAEDPALFKYLSDCGADYTVVHGDGRLNLQAARAAQFELLFLDAFSSDSIPVHLLTREAFEGYLEKLTPNGMIVVHISNNHLDLSPVVAQIASDLGLAAIHRIGASPAPELEDQNKVLNAQSHMVALARSPEGFGAVANRPGWQPLQAEAQERTWTDSYTNIVGVLRFVRDWTR